MRTLIDIEKSQVDALDTLSKQRRVSRAALIRQAIDAFLRRNQLSQEEAGFGLWRDQSVDGLEYQRRLREEW